MRATPPRPTPRPSLTQTRGCKATCCNTSAAYGTQSTASVTGGFPRHLVKRLPRLAGVVPLGTWLAMLGHWGLGLAIMPRISAARVITCRASVPGGWLGSYGLQASRMARYLRRLSLIVYSFWFGCAVQSVYDEPT